jgi:AraC-like DNA-binding protein
VATTVLRHDSDAVSFELAVRDPAPALRGLVRSYEDFRERSAAPLRRREVAIPDPVVILDLGEGWDVGSGDGDGPLDHHGSFAAGVGDRPSVVEHAGRARCMQVNLTPLGARRLLGLPLAELTNLVVPLDELLGSQARDLVERLAGTEDRDERFAIVEGLLLERAADSAPGRPDVAWACRRLVESDGGVPVAALAQELGCSRRHLTARFGAEVGLPPKAFARLLRFRRATDALLSGGEQRLAEIAAECGYADQSHLNREFRAFAGTTPRGLLASRVPGGAGVLA